MGIQDYSTTAASNTALFPENQAPSTVNDGMRQVQADIRTWYIDPQWINLGLTPTYATTSSFTVVGDQTGIFLVNRRLKLTDLTTLYGTIASSSYSAPNTTVTVTMDSGSLSASLSAVYIGLVSSGTTGTSLPGGLGNVTGQSSSVDGQIAKASGTGGKTIQFENRTGYVKVAGGVIQTPASTIPLADITSIAANSVLVNNTTSTTSITNITIGASTVLGRDSANNVTALTLSGLTATSGVLTTLGVAASSVTTNGYITFANPTLKLQWGTATSVTGGAAETTVTFPNAFASVCFGVKITPTGTDQNSAQANMHTKSVTTSNFVIRNTGQTTDYHWQAIGI